MLIDADNYPALTIPALVEMAVKDGTPEDPAVIKCYTEDEYAQACRLLKAQAEWQDTADAEVTNIRGFRGYAAGRMWAAFARW